MRAALLWYLVVQMLGAVMFRLAHAGFRHLPDAGYGVSKTLGVLVCGLVLWGGVALGLWRNDAGGALLVAAALVVAAAVAPAPVWPSRRIVFVSEVMFGVTFAVWCGFRAYSPEVAHTEQPMDLMMLAAMASSPTFPPADPWLAGVPVGYYYVGYWLMHTLALLTAQVPEVAYTLGQACWLALLVTGCASLGLNLAARVPQIRPGSRGPIGAGVLTAVVVAATANAHAIVDEVRAVWTGTTTALARGSFWPASRVIADTSISGAPIELITEFPVFSYLLGDNHPHLLAMPFVTLMLVVALGLLTAPRAGRTGLFLLFLTAGALVGMNTWDGPAAACVVAAVLGASMRHRPQDDDAPRAVLRRAVPLALGAGALLVPYTFTAQSQVRGVLPNLFHPTPIAHFLTMFATLLPGVVLLVVVAWRWHPLEPAVVWRRGAVALAGCAAWLAGAAIWATTSAAGRHWLASFESGRMAPLAVALERWTAGWPVLGLSVGGGVLAASLASRSGRQPHSAGLTFALLLAAIGLALVAVPELVFVRDSFENRMNTVFKFYYQAWLYLGVAGAAGIGLAWHAGGRLRAAAVLATMVVSSSLFYPVAAARLVLASSPAPVPTLDALAHLRASDAGVVAAIDWIRTTTPPGAVVVQAAGDSYNVRHSLLSTATGRPTLLGWEGHERQWRGDAYTAMTAGRLEALTGIYQPASSDELRATLDRWHVTLVYLGPLERARYAITADHEARLATVLSLVFEQGDVRLYRRPDLVGE